MPNDKFQLNIDDEFVSIFASYMGTWYPEIANKWLIWFEESWDDDTQSVMEKIYREELHLAYQENKKWLFTKDFLEIYPPWITKLYVRTWENYISVIKWESELTVWSYELLASVFLGEFYFLPFENRKEDKSLFTSIYGDTFYNFYSKHKNLLKVRLHHLFTILRQSQWKTVYIALEHFSESILNEYLDEHEDIKKLFFQNGKNVECINHHKDIYIYDFHWNKLGFGIHVNWVNKTALKALFSQNDKI